MGKLKLLVLLFIIACGFNNPDKDEHALASIITAECSVCDEEEQYLVGSVVLNRVDHWRYPNTVEEVISQENQFHAYCSQWYYPTKETLMVARKLIKGENRNYQVLYFYCPEKSNKELVKYWNKNLVYSGEFHNYATE